MRYALNTVRERITLLNDRLDSNFEYLNSLEKEVAELFEDSRHEYMLIEYSNDLDEREHSYKKRVKHENDISLLSGNRAVTLAETRALTIEKDFLLSLVEILERAS